jgi:hypothetical protein
MTETTQQPTPSARPGLLKTIGVLDLVFGGFLLLCGAGCLSTLVPFLVRNNPLQMDHAETQEVADQMRQLLIDDLRKQESAAATPTEKDRLRKARFEVESRRADLASKVDFAAINRDLPCLSRYLWADLLSGTLLNVVLIVAGIGLIRLKPWGRRLGIWVAAAKLVRLVALCALLTAIVVPSLSRVLGQFARTDVGEAFVSQAVEQQNTRSIAPAAGSTLQLSASDIVEIIRAIGYGYAFMSLGLGAIFPAVSLVVLTCPGARLAGQTLAADDEGHGLGARKSL